MLQGYVVYKFKYIRFATAFRARHLPATTLVYNSFHTRGSIVWEVRVKVPHYGRFADVWSASPRAWTINGDTSVDA